MAAYSSGIQSVEAGEIAIFRELGPERYKTDRQPQKRAEGLIVCTNRIISGYAVRKKPLGDGKSTAEGASSRPRGGSCAGGATRSTLYAPCLRSEPWHRQILAVA